LSFEWLVQLGLAFSVGGASGALLEMIVDRRKEASDLSSAQHSSKASSERHLE
jgi:hypothetical protein